VIDSGAETPDTIEGEMRVMKAAWTVSPERLGDGGTRTVTVAAPTASRPPLVLRKIVLDGSRDMASKKSSASAMLRPRERGIAGDVAPEKPQIYGCPGSRGLESVTARGAPTMATPAVSEGIATHGPQLTGILTALTSEMTTPDIQIFELGEFGTTCSLVSNKYADGGMVFNVKEKPRTTPDEPARTCRPDVAAVPPLAPVTLAPEMVN